MQKITCHECNQETFFNKQLIGGEVRICLNEHKGIYDSNFKFIRPAPNLEYKSPFQEPQERPSYFKDKLQERQGRPSYVKDISRNYDTSVICFYCKSATSLVEKDVKMDLKCNGCNGQGYYYDDVKNLDFVCDGCGGEGNISKKVEKRSCQRGHECFYSKNKFIKSCSETILSKDS